MFSNLWVWFFLLVMFTYLLITSRLKGWRVDRTVFGILGILLVALSIVGPFAHRAHSEFTFHMLTHLLLGMLAPLFIVLSTPMTLILRTIPVRWARRLSFFLRSKQLRFIHDPTLAALLNMGGLWILYTTSLVEKMHESMFLYFFIHLHVFLAGLLFTASMISMDPTPHRTSFTYRAVVLVGALASHSILAKYMYAYPPIGVPVLQAKAGGMLMYYGGGLIDGVLIFIFCYQWFRSARPRGMQNPLLHSQDVI
ncbi:cytochrome c oxidase assembly protein [Bacillus mesophilus]|uniref:Cytochrome c oxidase assembly protein n=2 Tax=Bacillus mesophilus TaxID=1808955 RepID=A0A6M0Q5A0_9BACI|nr:cytochrome c oxidase assembly protein [Bacillus mesophilus]